MLGPVKDYLKKVEKELQSGNATEHSHRPHLKSLIESFDKAKPERLEIRPDIRCAIRAHYRDQLGRFSHFFGFSPFHH